MSFELAWELNGIPVRRDSVPVRGFRTALTEGNSVTVEADGKPIIDSIERCPS